MWRENPPTLKAFVRSVYIDVLLHLSTVVSLSRFARLSTYFDLLVPHPVTERLWETSTAAPHAHLSPACLVVSQLDIVTQEVENENQHFLVSVGVNLHAGII